MKKVYKGIDLSKFILAIFVVAIHTHPFESIQNPEFKLIWFTLLNLAVPYFFIASGFFLFIKLSNHADFSSRLKVVKTYTIRIIKLYIYWTILFLPITIWDLANNQLPISKDAVSFFRGFLLIGENFYSWPLWYLLSMIISLIIIYFLMLKKVKLQTIFIISVILFIIAVTVNQLISLESFNPILISVKDIISKSFGTARLFTGMVYIMIGAMFATQKIRFTNLHYLIAILVGISLQLYRKPIISPLAFVLLPTLLFSLSKQLNLETLKSPYFFRKGSTVLYFTHMLVFFLFTYLFKEFRYYGWDAFLVSVLIPIALTPLISKLEHRIPFLKQLF